MGKTWKNLIFIIAISLVSTLMVVATEVPVDGDHIIAPDAPLLQGDATEFTIDGVYIVASDVPMEQVNDNEVFINGTHVIIKDEDNQDFPDSSSEVSSRQISPYCELQNINDQLYYWSPYFGVYNYPNNKKCKFSGGSGAIMAVFKFKTMKLQGKVGNECVDYFYITFPYSIVKKFCGNKSGKTVKMPNFNFVAGFVSDNTINNVGFNMSLSSKTSICHQSLSLSSIGDFGEIATPNNPAKDTKKNRLCEFFIRSPTNTSVQLEFLNFNLKGSCKKSSLVINLVGLKKYPIENSTRYCGTDTPPMMTSEKNEAFLVYQSKPKSKGFKVRYTAVP